MVSKKGMIAGIASTAIALSFMVASAASALTTSCVGIPTTTNITWTASSAGGVAPVAFLWGSGSTSTIQTIAEAPGTYSMTLQATDASSTIATTTCMATVAQPVPTITSFIANPTTITAGQSVVLSWIVVNASSMSLDNGIGAVSSTSITVSPTVTTVYTLSAVNPSGMVTAKATVTVTTTGNNINSLIQNLLNQINNLKAQIMQLLLQRSGGIGGTATSTPIVTCIKFNHDMKFGDEGNDVRELQHELSKDPAIFPPGLISGFFGKKTENALKQWQKKFGLGTTTGFFGPKTRGLLNGHCGNEHSVEMSTKKWTTTATSSHDEQGDNNQGNGKGKGNSHDD